MQNSFMSPKRFGKSSMIPRSKEGLAAAQTVAATAGSPSNEKMDKPDRKSVLQSARQNDSSRNARPGEHSGNPVRESAAVRQQHSQRSSNPANPARTGSAGPRENTARPSNPTRTGSAGPRENPTRSGSAGPRENTARPSNPTRTGPASPNVNPARAGRPNPSANQAKSNNPIRTGVSQNRPRPAAPQPSLISHANQSDGSMSVVSDFTSRNPISSNRSPVNAAQQGTPLSRVKPAARKTSQANPTGKSLKVIALGGLREVGKNMFVLEYGDEMIIVDCGIGFPEENMPGIDVVIPDMSYVFQNKAKVKGVFFTHGHEDHIGAVSWLLREVQAPLYGSKLTLALVKLKLEDRGGAPKVIDLHPVEDGDIIQAGRFSVEFIHTNHSIADANLLAIRTPVGIVVHTGDFKIDYTPINGDPISIPRIASIGQENPLLLLCESTNVEKPGFSMSESKVGESFINIFERAAGRIFVATFSSNIYRMQQIFTAAERFNRKVCLVGRSIVNVFQAANALGYMTMKPGTLVDINQIRSIPPDQLVIISTGSQGEPMSALTRMAFNEHQKIEIHAGDTVIISASPIPGNEKPIYRVINELFLRGADVIYAALAEVHASGHAYQEELKLMHQLVRPKFFVPIHGEYRMLYQHSLLAQKMGTPKENAFMLSNGDVLELTPTSARVTGYVPAEGVLIDGSSMGDIGNLVLRERKLLSDDGVISVSIAVDSETGLLLGEPSIQARGFIYESEAERIIDESQNKIHLFIKKCSTANKPLIPMIKSNALRDQLRDFLFDRTRRRPIVIVSLIEV